MASRALALAGAALVPRATAAADPNPDGFIEIEETRIGIGALSAAIGGGRLRFHGEERRFTARGLTAGGVGVSSLQARGEVFSLRRVDQFPGVYHQTSAEDFEDETGRVTVLFLRNPAGVRLRLRATRSGIALSITDGEMTVTWRE
jgi:hypothetical protein